jgi:hypothetical protein
VRGLIIAPRWSLGVLADISAVAIYDAATSRYRSAASILGNTPGVLAAGRKDPSGARAAILTPT